ncbi:MAG TPA: beta-galactosidase, partial [Opitutaceae bacterium]
MTSLRFAAAASFALAASTSFTVLCRAAASASDALPHFIHQDGRHELIVDGAPYLILGGQAHNSSAWPAVLPNVWSAVAAMDA